MDDETYYMSDALEKNNRDNIYMWVSEPTNGATDIVKGNNRVYIMERYVIGR